MRAIWKGSISFGLVSIPIALHNAVRSEEVKFHLLRRSDLSPVNYRRVAAVDGKEVPWAQIVKGYEYEKDKFVVLKDEDFTRVDIEATDTIDIIDFVDLREVNPIFFSRPYYVEPQKGGAPAYHLLRRVLADSGKAGISKVVIRTRQHLAAVKANGDLLALELMRFADEIVDSAAVRVPAEKGPGKRELTIANTLVDQLTAKWDPARYTDDYLSALMELIEQKVKSGGRHLPTAGHGERRATNVIDLATVLKQSLAEARSGAKPAPRARARPRRQKHAA
jgi:DNA end-binding protein Ku